MHRRLFRVPPPEKGERERKERRLTFGHNTVPSVFYSLLQNFNQLGHDQVARFLSFSNRLYRQLASSIIQL
jgi:hypothetical protein